MTNLDRPPTRSSICFLHVPKTAGTSIIAMMQRNADPAKFYHAEGRRILRITHLLKASKKILAGHFFLRDFSAELVRDTYIFTFLRNPIDRVVSQYHYFREVEQATDDEEVMSAKAFELRHILTRPGNNPRWINAQTTCLSGESRHKVADRESLERAIRNLQLLDFVGLYEQLQASWSRLATDLRWPDTELPVCNRTARRPQLSDVDPALVELIAERNALDLELYSAARSLFASRHVPPNNRHELFQIDKDLGESGTREIYFQAIRLAENDSNPVVVKQGEKIRCRMTIASLVDCDNLTVGVAIRDECGVEIYGTNTWLQDQHFKIGKGETFSVELTIKLPLAEGGYRLEAALHPGRDSSDTCFHWLERALEFRVVSARSARFVGLIDLEARFDQCNGAQRDSADKKCFSAGNPITHAFNFCDDFNPESETCADQASVPPGA